MANAEGVAIAGTDEAGKGKAATIRINGTTDEDIDHIVGPDGTITGSELEAGLVGLYSTAKLDFGTWVRLAHIGKTFLGSNRMEDKDKARKLVEMRRKLIAGKWELSDS